MTAPIDDGIPSRCYTAECHGIGTVLVMNIQNELTVICQDCADYLVHMPFSSSRESFANRLRGWFGRA